MSCLDSFLNLTKSDIAFCLSLLRAEAVQIHRVAFVYNTCWKPAIAPEQINSQGPSFFLKIYNVPTTGGTTVWGLAQRYSIVGITRAVPTTIVGLSLAASISRGGVWGDDTPPAAPDLT